MIELAINGTRSTVGPTTIEELRAVLDGAVPPEEVICLLRVNGHEVPEDGLDALDVGNIRTLEVQTARPETLARSSIPETIEWIGRVCDVLRSIGEDYRLGKEKQAAGRVVLVTEALQVLLELLPAIRKFADLTPEVRASLDGPWEGTVSQLRDALSAFLGDFDKGDPVRLADLVGHEIPEVLERFNALLRQMSP